jgi:hypothetical protein
MHTSRESRVFAVVLGIAAAVALVSARPFAGAWNDGSRLATVESMVDHGTFTIDDSIFVAVPAEGSPYRGAALEHGTLDKLLIDGHFYSDKSPVPALLLAMLYQCLQALFGLHVRQEPALFCYLMTVASSGVAHVVAVACVFNIGRPLRLTLSARLLLTASFGLATVALVYIRQVNNHILLLGVAAALMQQLAHLAGEAQAGRVPRRRWLFVGTLAGLGYTIDLGAGPGLLMCCGLLVAWRGRSWTAVTLFALAALPWLALHHAANFAVGGTFGPANAVAEYFQWEGCPFHGKTMTGTWQHEGPGDFLLYALALLFGKHGFIAHNLPLFPALLTPLLLFRRRPREWPELLCALVWCAGTWLVYSATSHNYSGANCTVRWFVPLLAPAYFALAVLMRDEARYHLDVAVLSGWGAVLMAIAWCHGPWIPHMVPGLWPIVAAALASWGVVTWRRRQKMRETSDTDRGLVIVLASQSSVHSFERGPLAERVAPTHSAGRPG